MQLVDWSVATATATRLVPPGPRIDLADAVATVEDLRRLAAEADAHVSAHTGLAGAGEAEPVTVVDRPGWIRSNVAGFFGLGQDQRHRTEFTFDADHPEIFASEDNGATPVEYVLVGLGACLTAGIAAVAQHRKIQLRSVAATLEGCMDIQGILGIDSDVRNGFDGIKVVFDIDADASREDIAALVAQSQKRSAVFDIVTNPTNVAVEVR